MNAPKYLVPKTLKEACLLLSKHKDEARVIAGGTDILVQMKHGEALPRYIINIRNIPEQDYIIYDKKNGLSIGALATIHAIEDSSVVQEKFGILAQAASQLGTAQIRNQATIAGNLCNAAPSAELAPALIVLGARVKIVGAGEERVVPIEDFFTGPGQTVLKADEILSEVQVPNLLPHSSGVYLKHTIRKALDLAIVGVGVMVTMEGDILSNVKIALGAVAPIPMRAKKAEGVLIGKKIKDELLEKAGLIAAEESSPISDVRGSAEYRRKMVKVLVGRAIRQAVEQVKTG